MKNTEALGKLSIKKSNTIGMALDLICSTRTYLTCKYIRTKNCPKITETVRNFKRPKYLQYCIKLWSTFMEQTRVETLLDMRNSDMLQFVLLSRWYICIYWRCRCCTNLYFVFCFSVRNCFVKFDPYKLEKKLWKLNVPIFFQVM